MTDLSRSKSRKHEVAPGDFETVIGEFQRMTGLLVCIKFFDRFTGCVSFMSASMVHHELHQSKFCRNVKLTRNEECKTCDLRQLPARCERERRLFVNTCHAGADEVIIPLFQDETLAGVAYVGQFRMNRKQPECLPLLTQTELSGLLAKTHMFAAYLRETLRESWREKRRKCHYREEVIHAFLQARLHENPGLNDLARHLGLSVTRTAHVVKAVTGHSFIELKDDMRLARSRNLLCSTYHKVAHIADISGFSSSQYFHRFFKRKTGMTPQGFRMQHDVEV
jgi:AraC-like DNA-binding protein